MEIDDRPVESPIDLKKDQPGKHKQKLRFRLFIFVVCLAISATMWLFIELMKDYTSDIRYSITFAHVPEDLILVNQADSVITLGVNAQGFELLVNQYLKEMQSVELDLSMLNIRQGPDGYYAYLPATRLLEQVGRQLTYAKSIIYIRPDTLFFRFSEIYRKRVPVRLDLNYSFAGQYQLSDSIRFSPQTIQVSSIKDVIDTIRFVSTRHTELNRLDSSQTFTIPLHKALGGNMIRYSDDSVRVTMKVQKYTEAVFTIPVSVTGNSYPVRIFPDQVEVSCQVPMSEYRELQESAFSAAVVASPAILSSEKRLQVVLTRMPSYVRAVRLKPDNVEYIIISK